MERGRGGEQALSFVEVLVAALLLGILLVVTVPQLFAPAELDVDLVARQVAADLRLAHRLALSGRANYLVTFNPAGGPFTSYSVARVGGSAEADFPKTLAADVSVTGTDQVTFNPSGAAAPSGTITFSFAAGGKTAKVEVVAATGLVRTIGP